MHVRFWPIESFRCDARFGPLSVQTGLRRAVSPPNLWVHGLAHYRINADVDVRDIAWRSGPPKSLSPNAVRGGAVSWN